MNYAKAAFPALLLLTAGPGCADTFGQIDADGDGMLSETELSSSGAFQRWDHDNDGALTRDELNTDFAALKNLDENRTHNVREREFYSAVVADLDSNVDGVVDAQEYRLDPGWLDVYRERRLNRRDFGTYRVGRSTY